MMKFLNSNMKKIIFILILCFIVPACQTLNTKVANKEKPPDLPPKPSPSKQKLREVEHKLNEGYIAYQSGKFKRAAEISSEVISLLDEQEIKPAQKLKLRLLRDNVDILNYKIASVENLMKYEFNGIRKYAGSGGFEKPNRKRFPTADNKIVEYFVENYTGQNKKTAERALSRATKYMPMIKRIFREYNIPEDLAYVAMIESSFKLRALSHAGARGLWQFIAGTARHYDLKVNWWVDERLDPVASTRAAAKYLKSLYKRYNSWNLALAAYNAGEATIDRAIRKTDTRNFWELRETWYLRRETKNYVPAAHAAIKIGTNPSKYGISKKNKQILQFDKYPLSSSVRLNVIAECAGTSRETIRKLNPALKRFTTPAEHDYTLKIPEGSLKRFKREIENISSEKQSGWRRYDVKQGETLSEIANSFGIGATALSRLNDIEDPDRLSIGQNLLIPLSNPPTGTKKVHRVKKGDSLYKIAQRYGTSVERIKKANNISRKIIYPGEKLEIPLMKKAKDWITYVVKPGDTLSRIAQTFNTSIESLKGWNNLKEIHLIHPGEILRIY